MHNKTGGYRAGSGRKPYGKIYVPDDSTASQVRKEIKNWLKGAFNV